MTSNIVNLKAAPTTIQASQPRARFNIRAPIVEISTVIAAVFAVMTYVGQDKTDATLADIKTNTARNAQITADVLEQSVAHLNLLGRIFPEAERTRLGIDKLIETGERQLKALRQAAGVQARRPASPPAPTPSTPPTGYDKLPPARSSIPPRGQASDPPALNDPEHPANKAAKRIWREHQPRQ